MSSSSLYKSSLSALQSTSRHLFCVHSRRCLGKYSMFSKLFATSSTTAVPPKPPAILPLNVPIEEEILPGYDFKRFYHPNPGDILDKRFKLKAKLGWGTSSTVWLAQDIRWRLTSKPYVAIKINNCNYQDDESANREAEISKHIVECAQGNANNYVHLRTIQESFKIMGPYGTHICLVMEPMREPMWLMRRRCDSVDKVTANSLPLFKLYILTMLDALNFLHTKCNVVHTDLKLDNILLGFESKSVIDDFVKAQTGNPMPRKVYDDRVVYLSHNDFGPLQGDALRAMCPKLVDFGLAQRVDGSNGPFIFPIQSDYYHAPEVLLGTGWSSSADMWNLGALTWELLGGETLFQKVHEENGTYSARHHLAEMIDIIGPIPRELIQREREMRHWRWAPEVLNSRGKPCNNAADFYGGPFFDDKGTFVAMNLFEADRLIPRNAPDCITDEEKDDFVDFMFKMLQWLPEKRATAAELMRHPWLYKVPTT
ncbi:CMGC protein kinase [Microthyrium microscopicum]|uniref:non-specific serine/threonine protein kinase n=1 Tax=Microthyrium microscopicum TaxID=703497 RepID=A0A6A6UIB8_9PEZI|nr:CMGC protein kinase [Microthyrium microscopicum]